MKNYSLLGWLNNFLKLRNGTRSNLKDDDDNIDSSSNEEDEKDEMPAISDDDTGRMSDAESNASELSAKRNVSPSMTNPKESSSRNQSGSNMVAPWSSLEQGEKAKKDTPNRMIQQEFLKLLTTQPTFQRRINVVSTLWINVEITLIRR